MDEHDTPDLGKAAAEHGASAHRDNHIHSHGASLDEHDDQIVESDHAALSDEAHARLHASAFGSPQQSLQGEAHTHGHGDDHSHAGGDHDDHDHGEWPGWLGVVQDMIPFLHGHGHGDMPIDSAMEGSARGIWAVKMSLLGLGLTALFQLIIVFFSGSVGLLADTIHNASDALTAIPLWIAFALGRRMANRRYTYGYGRAEDVAGVVIVVMIFASSVVAAYESILKLAHPQPLRDLLWVALAAIVGFLGNEGVALFRMRVGREIGSAALVADGQHARADGLTSLAVLIGVIGSALGFPLADPIIGLLITVAILFIVRDTALTMWRRLMDAVDPQLVDDLERTASVVPGVQRVENVRMRWFGHALLAELNVAVDQDLSVRDGHKIVEDVRHALFHAQPRLAAITVHADPFDPSGDTHHADTAHHEPQRGQLSSSASAASAPAGARGSG